MSSTCILIALVYEISLSLVLLCIKFFLYETGKYIFNDLPDTTSLISLGVISLRSIV